MLVTPINLNNDFKRYERLDSHRVFDTVSNRIYTTESSDDLIHKLEIIGRVNTDNLNNNGNGKLLDVVI